MYVIFFHVFTKMSTFELAYANKKKKNFLWVFDIFKLNLKNFKFDQT